MLLRENLTTSDDHKAGLLKIIIIKKITANFTGQIRVTADPSVMLLSYCVTKIGLKPTCIHHKALFLYGETLFLNTFA